MVASDLGRVRVRGRVGVADTEQLVRLKVERAHEVAVIVDQQQHDDDREADQATVEAPFLEPRIAPHADRDQQASQHDRDQRHRENPCVGAEPDGAAARPGPLHRGPDRLEELNGEDVAVDRRPQPQDEPPAGGRHDEAQPAVENPGLPDVVASGSRDCHDQARIGDHQERHPDAGDDNRGDDLALRKSRSGKCELVDRQRHEVSRQARIDNRVSDGPASDQASRLSQEERWRLAAADS